MTSLDYNPMLRNLYQYLAVPDISLHTYVNEKTFSEMTFVNFHYRQALTDKHLQLILMVGNTNFWSS